MARIVISLVVACLVSLPVVGQGLVDAGIIFVLAFGVCFGALLLITNP